MNGNRATPPCRRPRARCRALPRVLHIPYSSLSLSTSPFRPRSVHCDSPRTNIKTQHLASSEVRQSFWPPSLLSFVCSRPRVTDRRTFEPASRQVVCLSVDSYAPFSLINTECASIGDASFPSRRHSRSVLAPLRVLVRERGLITHTLSLSLSSLPDPQTHPLELTGRVTIYLTTAFAGPCIFGPHFVSCSPRVQYVTRMSSTTQVPAGEGLFCVNRNRVSNVWRLCAMASLRSLPST